MRSTAKSYHVSFGGVRVKERFFNPFLCPSERDICDFLLRKDGLLCIRFKRWEERVEYVMKESDELMVN